MTAPADPLETESGPLEDEYRIPASELRPLPEMRIRPFAADDPEALPRSLGPLPGDSDGTATAELHHLYAVLADEAEAESLGST